MGEIMLFNKNFNRKSVFILFFLCLFISNKICFLLVGGNADESWYNSVRDILYWITLISLASCQRGDDDFIDKFIEARMTLTLPTQLDTNRHTEQPVSRILMVLVILL